MSEQEKRVKNALTEMEKSMTPESIERSDAIFEAEMKKLDKREDGFYWIKWLGTEYVAYWYSEESGWLIPGFGKAVRDVVDIGLRVQRDSEVVRQRDEAVKALQSAARKLSRVGYSGQEFFELIARIEAEKSGVKP